MNERIKITIEELFKKALEMSVSDKYDYHISDIVNLCYDFNIEYTDKLIKEHDLYIP